MDSTPEKVTHSNKTPKQKSNDARAEYELRRSGAAALDLAYVGAGRSRIIQNDAGLYLVDMSTDTVTLSYRKTRAIEVQFPGADLLLQRLNAEYPIYTWSAVASMPCQAKG